MGCWEQFVYSGFVSEYHGWDPFFCRFGILFTCPFVLYFCSLGTDSTSIKYSLILIFPFLLLWKKVIFILCGYTVTIIFILRVIVFICKYIYFLIGLWMTSFSCTNDTIFFLFPPEIYNNNTKQLFFLLGFLQGNKQMLHKGCQLKYIILLMFLFLSPESCNLMLLSSEVSHW